MRAARVFVALKEKIIKMKDRQLAEKERQIQYLKDKLLEMQIQIDSLKKETLEKEQVIGHAITPLEGEQTNRHSGEPPDHAQSTVNQNEFSIVQVL